MEMGLYFFFKIFLSGTDGGWVYRKKRLDPIFWSSKCADSCVIVVKLTSFDREVNTGLTVSLPGQSQIFIGYG